MVLIDLISINSFIFPAKFYFFIESHNPHYLSEITSIFPCRQYFCNVFTWKEFLNTPPLPIFFQLCEDSKFTAIQKLFSILICSYMFISISIAIHLAIPCSHVYICLQFTSFTVPFLVSFCISTSSNWKGFGM